MVSTKKRASYTQSVEPVGEDEVAKSFEYMSIYFRIAIKINSLPFKYDKARHRLSLNRKSIKYVTWFALHIFVMIVETFKVSLELVQGLLDDQMSRGSWCLVLFVFLSWVFVLSLSISVHFKGDEMIEYMNQALKTRAFFKESELPASNDHSIVRAHMIISALQSFFQSIMVAAEGSKAHYIYSTLPEASRNDVTQGLWALYAFYRVISNFTSGYFHVFSSIFHVQTCSQILHYRDQQSSTDTMEDSVKSYRMLQILGRLFNESFSQVFIPFGMVFVASNVILGNFGSLRFYDQLDLNLYLNFPLFSMMMLLFLFTFYMNTAKVYHESSDVPTKFIMAFYKQIPTSAVNTLKNGRLQRVPTDINGIFLGPVNRNAPVEKQYVGMVQKSQKLKEVKCIARSCPIIAVRIGTFSPIKRATVVSFFDFLLGNTISVLLTWK